ncbi:hypothetical protein Syn7502_03592 (plasmid) [Synechococcus sp. PCC 7502]|uniref:plasmid replication protein, CyRepA1 family n=1 Tax=Synechococcus sp. PCC 7502 TaxID=1173263 RepID=UPI0002A000FE|nr:plasmid replication protein, CyRepA1 family [Synechococcus sp. PCC 7502]AFY75427.1 hypothetical protein Syn7502_03592 [Synechococcus sp. PCC 7502]
MLKVPHDFQTYADQVYQEWVIESAIAPELFFANTTVTADEVITYGGDVSYPIHEALNWEIKRWRTSLTGKVQRPEQYGTIIHTINPFTEDEKSAQVFQVKLEHPVLDQTKLKPRKYENPIGQGQVGGFAKIPLSVWQTVALRHNCPIDGSNFWAWVRQHNLPIIICEGMKKACALLSQGYIAIALRGITMGRGRNEQNNVTLQSYLQLFATSDRTVLFCFDTETKPKTKKAVYLAQVRTGKLFEAAGCSVKIIQLPLLPNTDKTGVDDFIVAFGADSFENLYNNSLPLASYQWIWTLKHQLTYKPSLCLNINDLSHTTLDIPKSGIIAIQSAKGTGKTKAIASSVNSADKLALLGHRVSLMRNLCQRLGVDFKGDIDQVSGNFITASAYTLRVGACVDSILAFNPTNFIGCDLVIDEVEQVLRHLISGSTCNKDGKRPALIARLQLLIRFAQRVIVADADLSDMSLDYLKALRGDDNDIYLIQNTYKPQGYPTKFFRAKSDAEITSELLIDISNGKKLFIATDSKASSKAIAKLVNQMKSVRPRLKVLLINSETSGGEIESEFIRNINQKVQDYDVVISTPSMSTGVSIEIQWFDKVYGMFYGTLTDADISQSLSRVRDNIPRVVWCKARGNNFSRIDRSEFPVKIKNTLQSRWDREASLIRASLGADLNLVLNGVTWDNPHIDLWAKIEAANNSSMWSLRDHLLERLIYEGNIVTVINHEDSESNISNLVKEAKQQVKQEQYQAIASAKILLKSQIQDLSKKESRSPDEILNETKTAIANFYCTDDVSPELVEYDRDGQTRIKILRFEALFNTDLAIKSDLDAISKQAKYDQGIFIPDQPCHILGSFIRNKLRLEKFLVLNQEYTNQDLENIGQICRQCAEDIKKYLGFNIPQDQTNIWIFRSLCSQLGITTKSKRVHENNSMTNYCWIDSEAWAQLQAIVARREHRRNEFMVKEEIPPTIIETNQEGAIDLMPNQTKEQEKIADQLVETLAKTNFECLDATLLTKIKNQYSVEVIRQVWQYLSNRVKATIQRWVYPQWLYYDS